MEEVKIKLSDNYNPMQIRDILSTMDKICTDLHELEEYLQYSADLPLRRKVSNIIAVTGEIGHFEDAKADILEAVAESPHR